ncbi:hypothetical protein AAFF_G00304570 [Aldrovandia affinis]|uniref:Uncharacterized protein n=1 Tax=Aldrovandia affinis TaxID=143900 RepID=A0AAD7WR06_9TELE|nr:hypothetical protein AAFF_G00304570 [Aldrovandia affinis]
MLSVAGASSATGPLSQTPVTARTGPFSRPAIPQCTAANGRPCLGTLLAPAAPHPPARCSRASQCAGRVQEGENKRPAPFGSRARGRVCCGTSAASVTARGRSARNHLR